MKYVVILGDGMSDYPIKELNDKTPLEVANKPFIDELARVSELGILKTVPDGMKPGSDVANLSVLGYNPKTAYTGRSPLEAVSIGIPLSDTDVTLRANLVTLSNEPEYKDKTMLDYSAGEISTQEAKVLIDHLKKYLDTEKLCLHSGVSYRHCLVVKDGALFGGFTPPHDITGKKIGEFLPKNKDYLELMKRSEQILSSHPINLERIKRGKKPANSIWFWGEGTKPALENYREKYGVKGGMISAVDLLKGIAKLSGMNVINVPGATGNYTTDFMGKAKACVQALKSGLDFVYIHIEAPDECGHQGDLEHKIYSIEQIDRVVEYIVTALREEKEQFKILICPDHPTPISIKTHASDSVPFMIYSSEKAFCGLEAYTEQTAKQTGTVISDGETLMKKFFA